ncbi:MAG: flagellar protein FlaG [Deltaproteobacteria bacterium]|nr:flagellar protein FlaG [Deltaproteobacteria bacterium]MBW2339995.1 flagellar protein FlaG [Deltaproteobacteria bacterium]
MLVKPVTIAGKNLASPAQARLPAEMPTRQESVRNAKPQDEPDLSRMTQAVAEIQNNLSMVHNVDLQFSVHEASGDIMVTVREQSTGEVIREIPPSEILDLEARLGEMVGLLFDRRG